MPPAGFQIQSFRTERVSRQTRIASFRISNFEFRFSIHQGLRRLRVSRGLTRWRQAVVIGVSEVVARSLGAPKGLPRAFCRITGATFVPEVPPWP